MSDPDDDADEFNPDDADQSAIEYSISDGLVLSERDVWMTVEDLVGEYGKESARRQVDFSNKLSADWLTHHKLDPADYQFPTIP